MELRKYLKILYYQNQHHQDLSRNSESFASEFLENLEDTFPRNYSNFCRRLKYICMEKVYYVFLESALIKYFDDEYQFCIIDNGENIEDLVDAAIEPKNQDGNLKSKSEKSEYSETDLTYFIRKTNAKKAGPISCLHCKLRFFSLHDFLAHLSSVHLHTRYFVCCVCSRSFRHQPAIVRHFLKAHRILSNFQDLKQISAVVTPQNIMGHPFLTEKEGDIHVEGKKNNSSSLYKCMCCSTQLKTMSQLETHLAAHLKGE